MSIPKKLHYHFSGKEFSNIQWSWGEKTSFYMLQTTPIGAKFTNQGGPNNYFPQIFLKRQGQLLLVQIHAFKCITLKICCMCNCRRQLKVWGTPLPYLDKLATGCYELRGIEHMFNDFWCNHSIKTALLCSDQIFHRTVDVFHIFGHLEILHGMCLSHSNIFCRSINTYYECSQTCKRLQKNDNELIYR